MVKISGNVPEIDAFEAEKEVRADGAGSRLAGSIHGSNGLSSIDTDSKLVIPAMKSSERDVKELESRVNRWRDPREVREGMAPEIELDCSWRDLREVRLEMEVGREPEIESLARLMSTTRLVESHRTPDQLQGSELAFQEEGRLVRDLARSHIAWESSDSESEKGRRVRRRKVRLKRGQWKGNFLPFLPIVEGRRWSEVRGVRGQGRGRGTEGKGKEKQAALASESGPLPSPGVWVGKSVFAGVLLFALGV